MPPSVDPPQLLPTPKEEKRVFLVPEKWVELQDAADFHSEAYAEMGVKQSLSRNDLVEGFLDWALDVFWADKGGRPKNAADRKKKVAAFADQLKAKLAEKKAKQADKSDDNQSR